MQNPQDYFERLVRLRFESVLAQERAARWSEAARSRRYFPALCQNVAAECYLHARALHAQYVSELKNPPPSVMHEIKFNRAPWHYYPVRTIYTDGI